MSDSTTTTTTATTTTTTAATVIHAKPTMLALVAFVIALSAISGGGGCSLEPETGERLRACVDEDSDPSTPVSFKDDIRPLLNGEVEGTRGCDGCHYATTAGTKEGFIATGLNLEKLRTLKAGGRETPPDAIIVPGKPCSSAIVKKLRGTFGNARMPKGGPYWDATKIQLMMDWIVEGANGEPED